MQTNNMVRKAVWTALVISLASAGLAGAHCQIPCGIYGDELRVALMKEHLSTIEKAMKQIPAMMDAENPNQVVRWVQAKEQHAEELSEIITFYFMAQRIKPASVESQAAHARYVKELTLLHQLLVTTMKAKQSTDLQQVEKAKTLLDQFSKSYLSDKAHSH
jgi:nickel superoxide dismutase